MTAETIDYGEMKKETYALHHLNQLVCHHSYAVPLYPGGSADKNLRAAPATATMRSTLVRRFQPPQQDRRSFIEYSRIDTRVIGGGSICTDGRKCSRTLPRSENSSAFARL